MSCDRKLAALQDCVRKHPRQQKDVCRHLHVAAGLCIFSQLCPEEVEALVSCSGNRISGLDLSSVPRRCEKYVEQLDGCIQGHQEAAQQRAERQARKIDWSMSLSQRTKGDGKNGEVTPEDRKIDIQDGHSKDDKGEKLEIGNMILLVVLYCMQGVPMGLSGGSMPFLLQPKASLTKIGIFSIASYPYSFKLLWSPIVDSIYSKAFGRRKSWIVPIQFMSAIVMIFFADVAENTLQAADVGGLTALFFVLVLLAATQDIAVDGWALTLLPHKHVGYASTCQTIGMNIGYFMSFTVFLALNDPGFCDKYLREQPTGMGLVTVGSYMKVWGIIYAIVTLCVIFKPEIEREGSNGFDSNNGRKANRRKELVDAYRQLWAVVKLPSVRQLSLVLVTYRLGVLCVESAAPLKLLEKGMSKEALAGLVLLEFPMELVSALLAGRWATSSKPFTPWTIGYYIRLGMAMLVTFLVGIFPQDASHLSEHPAHFFALALFGVITSFTSTLMFTAQGMFYNKISDPQMGGAYLTLLNTIANLGIILPKVGMYWLMDVLTTQQCKGPNDEILEFVCPAKESNVDNQCKDMGGECEALSDGFYPLAYCMVLVGLVLGQLYMRTLPRLQALSISMWHVRGRKEV